MEMTPVAVDPYWYNATHWYMEHNPLPSDYQTTYDQYVQEYESWLTEQGAELERHRPNGNLGYHPWIYFADPVLATAFILRWS
jgi:hypothetical protein